MHGGSKGSSASLARGEEGKRPVRIGDHKSGDLIPQVGCVFEDSTDPTLAAVTMARCSPISLLPGCQNGVAVPCPGFLESLPVSQVSNLVSIKSQSPRLRASAWNLLLRPWVP